MASINFRQQCKPLSGKLEWINIDELQDDLRNEIAKSNYAGMLHDTERNEKYRHAITCAVNQLIHEGKNNIHALDIGTGTGILAMMAAQAGSKCVTACEVFKPMADIASEIIHANNLSDTIHVVNKRSSNLELDEKADILVTEIFDTELIGEGVLPTLKDARARLLKTNSLVIPQKANTYVQLIESDLLYSMTKINKLENIKFPDKFHQCSGLANAFEMQINKLYPNNIKFLSEDALIKDFKFERNDGSMSKKITSQEISIQTTSNGKIHALLFWWDLILYEKENIVLSMEPCWIAKKYNRKPPLWRDHWMQAIYYLPEPINCAANDILKITLFHDAYSLWFHVSQPSCKSVMIDRPMCSCSLHLAWTRERFSYFNNCTKSAWKKLSNKCEISKVNTIGVIGDCSLLPIHLAKHFNQMNFLYYDTSCFRKSIENIVDENEIKNIQFVDEIEKLQAKVVLFDPYFTSSLLPWHNLRIITYLSQLRSTKIFPNRASLKACVVSFADLWRVRAPIAKIDEFDLRKFDELISSALQPIKIGNIGSFETVEPFSVWEFNNKILSDVVTLAQFTLTDVLSEFQVHETCFEFLQNSESANAVVIWLDFEIDGEILFTCGLDHQNEWVNWSRQGVYFLRENLSPKPLLGKAIYEPSDEEFLFSFYQC